MFEQFKVRAEAAGCDVHRFATRLEASTFIQQVLRTEGGPAVWAAGEALDGGGLAGPATRQAAREARVGVTRMDWGIADTGTLVQDATAVEARLASTLPPVHVALLETGRILPDLDAALATVSPGQSPWLAFVTGPSRTADIERVLAIGVHGPERVVVVCVDEVLP